MKSKNFLLRLIAGTLAALMVVTSVPANTYAGQLGDNKQQQEISDDQQLQEETPEDIGREKDGSANAVTLKINIDNLIWDMNNGELDKSFNVRDYGAVYSTAKKQIEVTHCVYHDFNLFGELSDYINDPSYISNWLIMTLNDTDVTEQDYFDNFKFKWQELGEEGSFKDISGCPNKAGTYKLVVSMDGVFAVEAPAEIVFKLNPEELDVYYDGATDNVITRAAGTTAKEIKDAIENNIKVRKEVGDYPTLSAVISGVSAVVYESKDETKTAIADDAQLVKGTDYTADVTYRLTQPDFCTSNQPLKVTVKINELIGTKLEIETKNGADVTIPYTGSEIEAPDAADYSWKVSKGADPVWEEITVPADSITGKWVNSYGKDLADDFKPVDAGAYYYKLTYTDTTGMYENAEAVLKVVITPKKAVVVPNVDGVVAFAGQNVRAITDSVGWDTYEADESGKATSTAVTAEGNFWGVSAFEKNKEQYYAPVFAVEKGVKNTEAKEGEDPWKWEALDVEYGYLDEPSSETVKYRVVFAGQVALYTNGKLTDLADANADINSSNKNYYKMAGDAVEITVSKAANATIDTSAITFEKGRGTAEEPFTKIYDEKGLYENRDAYKKAVVKAADGTEIAADTDPSIYYRWYDCSSVNVIDDEGKVTPEMIKGSTRPTKYDELPKYARLYMLEITYYDKTGATVAEPAYVYYAIDKQKVVVKPSGTLSAYIGSPIAASELLDTSSDFDYEIKLAKDNKLDELVDPEWLPTEEDEATSDHTYHATWSVLGASEAGVTELSKLQNASGNYQNEHSYALAALGVFICDEKGNVDNGYELYTELDANNEAFGPFLCPITTKKPGTKPLTITIDSKVKTEKVYDGEPFDIDAALKAGLIKATTTDGAEVPVTGEGAIDLQFCYNYYNPYDNVRGRIINADTYSIDVYFYGDDNYEYVGYVGDFTIAIKKRDVEITPVLKKNVEAGTIVNYDDKDTSIESLLIDDVLVEGYIEADADEFINGEIFKAFYQDSHRNIYKYVYGWDNVTHGELNDYSYYDEVIKFNKKYTVRMGFSNCENRSGYASYYDDRDGNYYDIDYYFSYNEDCLKDCNINNYNLIWNEADLKPVRGKSEISSDNRNFGVPDEKAVNYKRTELAGSYDYETKTWNITPSEGVYFTAKVNNGYDKPLPKGNYVVVEITAPYEYVDNYNNIISGAEFENSITEAGGYVNYDATNGHIYALFNVSEDNTSSVEKKFDITWESGYTEHFVLTVNKSQLLADLTTAVAPKTLAFNGVAGKMAVGESQHVNINFTRELNTDVVSFNYKVVSGEKYVTIDSNTGYVTALTPGDAVIEVYPVRETADGTMEALKMPKSVTAKIKVTDVSVPKIIKTVAGDSWVDVYYSAVNDGYRREVYIAEGNWTARKFETTIAEMGKNEFPGVMFYIQSDNLSLDKKSAVTYTDDVLKYNTNYTVYVRNVSEPRTLADGSEVVLSAKGSVKTFKTIKCTNDGLKTNLDITKIKATDIEKGLISLNEAESTDLVKTWDVSYGYKGAVLDTDGLFKMLPGTPAADADDETWYDLALSSKLKGYYTDAKLVYAVTNDYSANLALNDKKEDGYTTAIKYSYGTRYYKPSTIATVNKKGVISIKGVGKVTVWAIDTVTGHAAPVRLNITAEASKMSSKAANVQIGSYINAYSYLKFLDKAGKEIKGNVAQIFPIELSTESEDITVYDNYIVAINANKTAKVTAKLVGTDIETTINVSTKSMNPVKGLKITDITDSTGKVSFTTTANITELYPKYNQYGDLISGYPSLLEIADLDFRVDIYNGRTNLVKSENLEIPQLEYDLKTKNYSCNVEYIKGEVLKDTGLLARLSGYTVKVTPVFNSLDGARAASKNFKTTNVPASHSGQTAAYVKKYPNSEFGMTIYVNETYNETDHYINYRGDYIYGFDLNDHPFLAAGNTYNLELQPDNDEAKNRVTDTLSWKSTKPGIASVKVLPGTYTAILQPKKAGVTYIEVTSRVTKKIIARYPVYVKPVGNGSDTYGDFPYGPYEFDPYYTSNVEVLNVENTVSVSKTGTYNYTWVQFTAPGEGEYEFATFYRDSYGDFYGWNSSISGDYYELNDTMTRVPHAGSTFNLKDGQTIYLRLSGNFALRVRSCTIYTKLALGATADSAYKFTAPEDGVYEFYVGASETPSATVGLKKGESVKGGTYKGGILIPTANSYNLVTVKKRVVSPVTTTAAAVSKFKNGETVYLRYKAPAAGTYTFTFEGEKYDTLSASYATSLTAKNASSGMGAGTDDATNKKRSWDMLLNKDEEIVIFLTTSETEYVETIKASVSEVKVETVAVDAAPVKKSVPADGEYIFSFDITDANARYDVFVDGGSFVGFYKDSIGVSTVLTPDGTIGTTGNYFLPDGEKHTVYGIVENTTSAAVDVNININKVSVNRLNVGDTKAITLKDYSEATYALDVPTAGYYEYKVSLGDDASHGVHLTIGGNDGTKTEAYSNGAPNDRELTWYWNPGLCSVSVYATGTAAGKTTAATLSASYIKPTALPADGKIKAAKNSISIYEFTTPATDNYSVAVTGATTDATVKVGTNLNLLWAFPDKTTFTADGTYSMGSSLINKKMYFMVENTSDADKDITINVTGEMAAIKDITAPIEAGKTEIRKFVASEVGAYVMSFPKELDVVATYGRTYSSTGSGYAPIADKEFFKANRAGEIIYFKVVSSSSESRTLGVSRLAPVELKVGSDSAIAKESTKIYKIVIPSNGRYNLSINADSVDYSINVYDDELLSSYYGDITYDNYTTAGTYYALVEYTGTADDKKVSLTTPAKLSTIAAGNEMELKNGDEKVYKFVVPENGYYTFEPVGVAGVTYDIDMSSGWFSSFASIRSNLYAANDEVYVKATATADATGNVKITKAPSVALKIGGETNIPVKNDENVVVTFAPKAAGTYEFRVKKYDDAITYISNMVSTSDAGYFGAAFPSAITTEEIIRYVEVDSDKVGKESCVALNATVTGTDAKNITVNLAKLEVADVEVGKDIATGDMKNGQRKLYTFKPTETGIYRFSYTSDPADKVLYNTPYGWNAIANSRIFYAGEEYDVEIQASDDAKFTFKAEKVVPTALKAEAIETKDLDGAKWFVYTADKDSLVEFEATVTGGDYFNLYRDMLDKDSRISTYSPGDKVIMAKGDKMYMYVYTYSPADVTTKATATAIDKSMEADKDTKIEGAAAYQTVIYTFKPSKNGLYNFTDIKDDDNVIGSSIIVTDVTGNALSTDGDYNYTMDAGVTYFVHVTTSAGKEGKSATIKPVMTSEIHKTEYHYDIKPGFGRTPNSYSDKLSDCVFIKYTCTKDGYYEFKTDKKNANIYYCGTSASTTTMSVSPSGYLYAGNTYYFRICSNTSDPKKSDAYAGYIDFTIIEP